MKSKSFYQGVFLLIMSFYLLSSCGSSKKMITENEDFDAFYEKFHADTDFQMERIIFPLEGKSVDADGEREWTPSNWIPMKVEIYDVDTDKYKTSYNKTENTFTQKFWLPGTGFSAEYRFEKRNGKWFLVYASDTNL